MYVTAPGLAFPPHTEDMAWIPTGPGKSFRPLRFEADGWSELMRLEPGSLVAPHRHTGEVHAYNLSGSRQILGTDELVGPGDYVYEPTGNIDSWQAVSDLPCIVHIKVVGAVEYLDTDGQVIERADSASQRATYLAWCQQGGVDRRRSSSPDDDDCHRDRRRTRCTDPANWLAGTSTPGRPATSRPSQKFWPTT